MGVALDVYTGPLVGADGGGDSPLRKGRTGSLVATDAHGRYYEGSSRGAIYTAANQAAQAVTVALATTYTGILLYNPPGSGKLLNLLKIKYALSVAPAAIATIGLLGGFSATGGVTAQTTKLAVQSARIGDTSAGAGIALSAATIVTPTWIFQLEDGFTAAALPNPTLLTDLEGMFSILPGGFLGIGALTAVTGLGSIAWEEVPV